MHPLITRPPRPGSAAPIVLLAGLVACAACAEPARAPAPPRAPLGTTHVAPPGTMPPDTRPPPLPALPPSVHRLDAAARELARGEPTRSHREIVEALRALADAGEQLAPGRIPEISAIRRAADELERSPPSSLQHADYVRYGLDAALDLFTAASPRDPLHLEEYLARVRALRLEIEAIDPDTPLRPQHRAVARALEAAVRATYVAHGAPPPEHSASRE